MILIIRRKRVGIREEVIKMKKAAPVLAASSIESRNTALLKIKEALIEEKESIFEANRKDIAFAKENAVSEAVLKRLKFDEGKLKDVTAGIDQLVSLADPLGRISLKRQLDEGLNLYRVSCPIGVIGVIFEARPDALVQISTLCIKSGNCAVLKGGKETANTNKRLFEIIYKSALDGGLPENSLLLAQQHSEIDELLLCDDCVDLLIPRGSNAFVRYIMDNTKIPVMGHADGICHIYVDKDADVKKALDIIADAKTQYTAACNAVETLLIDRGIAGSFLPLLAKRLKEENVRILGTSEVSSLIEAETITEDEFKEYLELSVSVKLVAGVDEAIGHINKYGSHHTDSIITSNSETAERFMQMVDSAGVYQNCSTRFADGFRYGFGAEVGISTGKIHARGPVGLEGLVTYKYKLYGDGHIVGDYASGKKSFNFKDL
jgi:glutamate-5-semialdehyde dehydrogenase